MGGEGQIEKSSPILPQSLLGEGQTPKEGPSQRRSGPSSPAAPGEPAIERRPPSCLDGTRKCAPGSPSFQRCPGSEVAAAAERPCDDCPSVVPRFLEIVEEVLKQHRGLDPAHGEAT